jgi:hypothetical protein
MRAHEFVIEARDDQIELEDLATKIAQYLLKGGQRSTVGKITGSTGVLSNVKVSLRTRMPKTQGLPRSAAAAYDPSTKTIIVPRMAKDLTSELVHELRHALDDVKSSGRFLQGRKTNTPISKNDDPRSAYLSLPLEINARFSQAIHSIIKDLEGTNPTRKDIVDAIRVEFFVQSITPFFPKKMQDPAYRRLFSRALNYLEGRL